MRNFDLLAKVKSQSCDVCGKRPVDPCHIKSVGSGGADVPENLLGLCRKHHTEQHAKGWVGFLEKHPTLAWQLETRGWKVQEIVGKKKLVHDTMGGA